MFEKCENFFFSCVDNTNRKIKKIFQVNKDFDFISLHTKKQTLGRGRKLNKWISKEGDFTCSYLINKSFKISMLGQLNIIISISILECLKRYYPNLNFYLKWPNDILIDDKKIGGVLIETNINKGVITYLVVGIGINFVSNPILENYKTAKILDFTNKIDTVKIFHCLSKKIKDNIVLWNKKNFTSFKKKWMKSCKDIGNEVLIKMGGKHFIGVLEEIDDSALLVLKTKNNNIIKVSYGDII